MSNIEEVLNKQIGVADALLKRAQAIPDGDSNTRVAGFIRYDEKITRPLQKDVESWQTETTEFLRVLYGEDARQVGDFERCIRDKSHFFNFRESIQSELQDCISKLQAFIKAESMKQDIQDTKKSDIDVKEKTPMVFISHSSKDKKFAESLVELLEDIGFDSSNLFCSSVDGYGVGLSEDIFETLRGLFQKHNLYVIFIHSPRYYTSPVSLNEMGAAWVLRTDFCSFLTTDMDFGMMKGVVNGSAISIKVNAEDTPARLTELKDKLSALFHLSKMDAVKWERKRNSFIKAVNAIDYVSDNTAISLSPNDDEYKRLRVEKLKREEMERKQAKVRGNIIEGRSKGSRILKVFNAGQNKARKVSVEWLNPDDSIMVQQKFGLLGEISPQSSRSYNMALCEGHIPTMRLRYTWSDDNDENNTYEEDVQI